MKTTTKKPDLFTSMLPALRAAYDAEIARLADVYRTRILSGEFSGRDNAGDLAHTHLERELESTHPWATDTHAGRAVLAVSPWAHSEYSSVSVGSGLEVDLSGPNLASEVGECMAHDILAVASALGWVKRYRERDPAPYLLRVA